MSRSSALLLVLCVALLLPTPAFAADEPDAGGLEIEEGLRLRIYWIGETFDASARLDEGQSPNVDVTVPGVSVTKDAVFQDKQDVDEATDETIADRYIARWSGWIQMPKAGVVRFRRNTDASTRLTIGGSMVIGDAIELDAGWHAFELHQSVPGKRNKAIRLEWQRPGEDGFASIPTQRLRAPKFFFRPTQRGKKDLVAQRTRPGLGQKVAGVHPGYRVTNIRPDGMDMPVGGLGMLSDGRLVVARFDAQTLKAPSPTAEPNGELWLLSNVTADDPKDVVGEQIATGLYEPSGVYVIDDAIYVSQRSELTKFTQSPDETWQAETIASGWDTNDFHQISAGLPWVPGPTAEHPGFFYMSRGAGLGKNQNPPNHASVWKIDLSQPDGENVEVLTGGHRTPNGLGLNTAGDCFVIDNQGGWTPANEINHVQQGRFYGYYLRDNPPKANAAPFQPEVRDGKTGVTPPAISLPQDEIGNSPTELLLFPKGHVFEGQMALGDMRYGGLNRVFLEKVNGVYQGCAMRFTQGLEAGPNRIFFGPDGSLYVGGIGGRHASTWYWNNEKGQPTYGGLERLTPTGQDVFEIDKMIATRDGFILSFTKPIAKDVLEDPSTYAVKQWTYVPTGKYGGPKIDLHDLSVTQAVASDDGQSVRLVVPNLREGFVVHLQTDPTSTDGDPIWSGDIWYTLNQIPQ
ncbi:MAG: hypothetical protein ACPGYV_05415 [Phycisphaeraceae bacterium]